MTIFFASTTFLLLGLIIGAFVSAYFIHRYYENIQYDEFDEEEMEDFFNNDIGFERISQMLVQESNTDMTDYIKKVKHKLSVCEKNEEYHKATYYRDLLDWTIESFEDRKLWFLDRIGKKVRQSKITCPCEECKDSFVNGAMINNREFAMVIFGEEMQKRLMMDDLRFEEV